MGARVRYFQFRTRRVTAQSEFLSALFEWNRVVDEPDQHILFDHGGPAEAVQGDVEYADDDLGGLVVYWEVDDIRATCQKTTELGGRIVMQPTELVDGAGTVALIGDPGGNTLGLYQSPAF